MSRNLRGYIGFATDQSGYTFKSSLGGIATLFDLNLDISTQIITTGGTILTPGDGKKYHVFTGTGVFSSSQIISNASIMLIGGGGAGGGRIGGGGGAGGYLLIPTASIPSGSNTVTIGGGGEPVTVTFPNSASVRASDSTFLSYRAYGGGGGSSDNGGSATTGGSGGGGAANAGSTGAVGLNPATPAPIIASDFPLETHPYAFTQGNSGGPNTPSSGGGGGAGGAGTAGGVGAGGVGVAAGLTLPPAYGTPGPTPGRWFAGGGGASDYSQSGVNNVGGAGGGGKGSPSSTTSGVSGTENTGGGGGGGGQSSGQSGAGGSGIVVIAYTL